MFLNQQPNVKIGFVTYEAESVNNFNNYKVRCSF